MKKIIAIILSMLIVLSMFPLTYASSIEDTEIIFDLSYTNKERNPNEVLRHKSEFYPLKALLRSIDNIILKRP